MKKQHKLVEYLSVSDIKDNPVWQYCNIDERGETAVTPVRKTPVSRLAGKLVGTQVKLANGDRVWSLIGNVDANNPRLTEHFLTVSIEKRGKWFTLARYHDFDYSTNGPEALARFLGLELDQVFPISYDISKYAKGNIASLSGEIRKEPKEMLSRSQIIALAVS